jgi:hypothetical protein
MEIITNHSFCFQFDVVSAYHHVSIALPHTDFLGFSWKCGNVKWFAFLVLPVDFHILQLNPLSKDHE